MIGAGRMARFHLEVLKAFNDVEIVALANRGQDRGKVCCEDFSIPNHYTNYLEMLDNENLDAVFSSVSVDQNFEIHKACLERGIATLIEKPPALNLEDMKTLIDLAEAKDVVHMIGVQRRFYSHILKAIELVKEKGRIYNVVVEAPERFEDIKAKNKFTDEVLAKWILANGIHLIDLMKFIGGDVANVVAIQNQWKDTVHPDSYHALVEFESGTVGQYTSNWSSPGGWSVKIYGDGCRVDIQPIESGKIYYSNGDVEDLPISQEDKDFKPGVYAQNRMFLNAVKGVGTIDYPACDLRDCLSTMKIVDKFVNSPSTIHNS